MNKKMDDLRRTTSRRWTLIVESMCNHSVQAIVTFTTLLVGTLGYGTALLIFACAQLKLLFPEHVGVWINFDGNEPSEEILGWWLIPIGVAASVLLLRGTTLLIKGIFRFTKTGPAMALSVWATGDTLLPRDTPRPRSP